MPRVHCFWLLMQLMARAFARALLRAGSSMAARMAMIAMTTSNSIKVKDLRMVVLQGLKETEMSKKSYM